LGIAISNPKTTSFQSGAILYLHIQALKTHLQRRKGKCETPASQSYQNTEEQSLSL